MWMGQDGRRAKVVEIRKSKGIHPPNNTAVIISIINTAKKVVRPKLAPTTMLLPKVIAIS